MFTPPLSEKGPSVLGSGLGGLEGSENSALRSKWLSTEHVRKIVDKGDNVAAAAQKGDIHCEDV